jgi:hypothetical protein
VKQTHTLSKINFISKLSKQYLLNLPFSLKADEDDEDTDVDSGFFKTIMTKRRKRDANVK